MPPTPAPAAPRDVTTNCSVEQLIKLRERALELAHSRPLNGLPGARESDAERRTRITADAAAYVEFMLAGKIYGT